VLSVEQACAALQDARGDALAVLTMSPIAYWDRRDDDFRLIGLMGSAAAIGLGLALGAPDRRVLVVDGDGSLLMQLGVLSAIGGARPRNLVHVVIDNAIYAISGGQPMPVATDWPALMHAAGYKRAVACDTPEEINAALGGQVDGPLGIAIRCQPARPDYPVGSLKVNPADEPRRVRAALDRSVVGD
jgi:thiamine pyrophosphate-dependent acetolactate synthase large subunit-like protein